MSERAALSPFSNVGIDVRDVVPVSPHAEARHPLFVVRRLGLIDTHELCPGVAAIGNRDGLAPINAGERSA